MEIVEDVNRAVRFIRSRAREYGIDPRRLGITGGSGGRHGWWTMPWDIRRFGDWFDTFLQPNVKKASGLQGAVLAARR